MAHPRKAPAWDRIRAEDETYVIDGTTITFDKSKKGGSAQAELWVQISGNGIVSLTDTNSPVHGLLILVEADGRCAVQRDGYATGPGGASATLTAGSKIVGAQGAASARGYIKSADVTALAQIAVARHTIITSADPTKVVVDLD